MALSSPFNGTAVATYLSSPTYTVAVDTSPSFNSKQYAVTAIGGTQTTVTVNSLGSPFTMTWFKPTVGKILPPVNGLTLLPGGRIESNTWSFLTRKGVIPYTGMSPALAKIETKISIPAGALDYDTNNVAAMFSAHIGALVNQLDALVTACKNNVITI